MGRTRSDASFPSLPPRPLGRAVMRKLDRGLNLENQVKRWGVEYRTAQKWIDGTIGTVEFNTADKVLCRLGLHWWDVWTPQNTPDPEELRRIQRAFEGDESLMVA
jgi:hypothetical protein